MTFVLPDPAPEDSFLGQAETLKPLILALFVPGGDSMTETSLREKILRGPLSGKHSDLLPFFYLAAQYAVVLLIAEDALRALGGAAEWEGGLPNARYIRRP